MITTGSIPAALSGSPGPRAFTSAMPPVHAQRPPRKRRTYQKSAYPEKPQAFHPPAMLQAHPDATPTYDVA